MGAVRVGVADALYHRNFALVEHVLDWAEVGVEGEVVVDRQHFLAINLDQLAIVVVGRAVVRDESVHEVVAARKLHYNHDRVFSVTVGWHLVCLLLLACL